MNENPSSGRRYVQSGRKDGQADMIMLTVTFRNFATARKNNTRISFQHKLQYFNHPTSSSYLAVPLSQYKTRHV